jgi:DNA helicase-2/ATP-dependent DNA helicase PcrA
VDLAALVSDLTAAQRRAVESDASAVCILAGAGSGKTRVLTRRVAYRVATGSADAAHILTLTFTRRAAGELAERLRDLGMRERLTAGTFHAVAYAQLRQYWADRGERPPQLLDRKARLLARLVPERGEMDRIPLADLAAEIEWASARLISADRYPAEAEAARRRLAVSPEAVAALLARYQTEKRRRGLVDFDDLLARCAEALERDPTFGAAQRWRWRHLFVDEFQDLNPLQYRLLMAWLGPSPDVCVVGDANQAVYGWNGADVGLLSRLPECWPGVEVIHLDDNHRCSPQVVAAASRVLGSEARPRRSARPDGPPALVRSFADEVCEARGVVAEVAERRAAGMAWEQMALLVRTNAQIVPFELACRGAKVPYRVAAAQPLLEDPAVRALVGQLEARRAEPFSVVVADLKQLARSGDDQQMTAVRTLVALAEDYRRLETVPTVAAFLSWLAPATSADRVDVGAPGVTLSTFHRAKGLEWAAVWVAGLEAGLVPIAHAQTGEALAEERRLLYVAVTRAGDELRCSWAESRTFGERSMPREPSPWVAAIAGPATDGASGNDGSWRQRLAGPRDQLARCRRPGSRRGEELADPGVVDALRAWRAGAARAAGVPAHVVLHDATLAAVAVRRPATAEDLLRVPGLGAVKVARYGEVLLDVVHKAACA